MGNIIPTTLQGTNLGLVIAWTRDFKDIPIGVHEAIIEICESEPSLPSSCLAIDYFQSLSDDEDDANDAAVVR